MEYSRKNRIENEEKLRKRLQSYKNYITALRKKQLKRQGGVK